MPGATLDIQVTPRRQGDIGLIGIGILDPFRNVQPTLLGAAKMSVERNVQFAGLIVQTLRGLLTRETSPSQLMGPVAIAQMSGDTAAAGWISLFGFMAMLSLNLGLLNLLPIPVLDGGHLLFFLIEAVKRRPVSVKVREIAQQVGMVLLIMLMILVFYNDITRLFFSRGL